MRQVVLAAPAPRGAHAALAVGTAVVCMTAAASQLCRGLGSSVAASRQQQLVRHVHALQIEKPADYGNMPKPAQSDSSLQKRLVPLLTDGLCPKVRSLLQPSPQIAHGQILRILAPMVSYQPALWLQQHLLFAQGPGGNDRSGSERVLNVLTSLPFLLVGTELLRCRHQGRQSASCDWPLHWRHLS
jgi:hypothetical protein